MTTDTPVQPAGGGPAAAARTKPAPRARRKKGEGQWALGYREPLNPNERMKKDSDGLEVRQRILDIYSKTGFDGIDPGDLRGRMRWRTSSPSESFFIRSLGLSGSR